MAWELPALEEMTASFFEMRSSCDELFPGCLTSIKPKGRSNFTPNFEYLTSTQIF
jgi:hypothetical protein